MRLSDLTTGQRGVIVKILGHGAFRRRMMEMGFVKGHEVTVLLHAPLRDPIKYSIMGYEVSLRTSEAQLVVVNPIGEDADNATGDSSSAFHHGSGHKEINIALVGNPNCGKTSLFNIASGAKEHVGNYSGVTVDAKKGSFRYKDYKFNIVDLPGTYSLSAYSPEELYVRKFLRDEMPDVIVNVVVASNLERNLYLTTELIDMDRSMVIALNMYDELLESGDKLDYKTLGEMIGVPMVPTVSRTGHGIDKLFDTIIDVYEERNNAVRHVHVHLSPEVEESIKVLREALRRDGSLNRSFSTRYLAIKLLEGDTEVEAMINPDGSNDEIIFLRNQEVKRIERLIGEDAADRKSVV